MAKTSVKNVSGTLLYLPTPYTGSLKRGEVAILSDPKATVLANLGGADAIKGICVLETVAEGNNVTYHMAAVPSNDAKSSVRAATTANITLSGTQTIDGVVLVAGDRVLVKDQTSQPTNGLYVVASGAWSRAADADANSEVTPGLSVYVEEGTANAQTTWDLVTVNPITVGTTNLTFSQVSGGGGVVPATRTITAGAGLTGGGDLSANRTLNVVANADASIVVNPDDIQVGVLASDAQHGLRGGGTQHSAVTTMANGFMSAADKVKLDGFGFQIGAVVSTSDATPTVIATVAAATGKTTLIMANFWAIKSDATQGAAYHRFAAFRNNAGTVTQIGATSALSTLEDDNTWDVDFNVSGTNIQLRVTGAAMTNINWGVRYFTENA